MVDVWTRKPRDLPTGRSAIRQTGMSAVRLLEEGELPIAVHELFLADGVEAVDVNAGDGGGGE